jgi:hypothetical protein
MPIFIAPLLICSLACKKEYRKLLSFISSLFITALILLIPTIGTNAFNQILLRYSNDSSIIIGGLSFFGLLNFPYFFGIANYIKSNIQQFSDLILFSQIALSIILSSLNIWSKNKALLLNTSTFMISFLLVSNILVNPQYLTWLLPFICILIAINSSIAKSMTKIYWALTFSGLLFYISLSGISYLFLQMNMLFSVPTTAEIIKEFQLFTTQTNGLSFLPSTFGLTLMGYCAIISTISLVLTLKLLLKLLQVRYTTQVNLYES